MTAPDFFLWGYVESKVYDTRPHSTHEIKYCIMEGSGIINGALLQRVVKNFRQ
jgi:hypothetical protein